MEILILKENNTFTVKQHNAITEARYEMTALQKDIMYMLLPQLKEDNVTQTKYKISFRSLITVKKVSINKEEIRQAAKGLMSSVLTLYDEIQKKFLTIAILSSADYGVGTDKDNLIVEFDPELYPFLFDVKSSFTTFILQNALRLKSKYSKRIYEMLCQFKSTGIFRISVQELKERLGLIDPKTGKENSYRDFSLFAAKVLEVAKKEINEHTDISFEYITRRTGRKITKLEFVITTKEVVKGLTESTLVDPQVAKLKERLVTKFRLSKTLAKKIIETIPTEEIHEILHGIQLDMSDGKIKKIGGYATTFFQNRLDGVPPIAQKSNSLKYSPPKPTHQMPIGDSVSSEKKVEEGEKPIEYSNSFTTSRSKSSASIGDLLAQIGAPKKIEQINSAFSKEEQEAKAAKAKEKYVVWRKLYNNFRIDYVEVDSLMTKYSLEYLKAAISKVEEELKDQENPQESGQMIHMLKKHLNLV
jgi:plasmid replication initiation protein